MTVREVLLNLYLPRLVLNGVAYKSMCSFQYTDTFVIWSHGPEKLNDFLYHLLAFTSSNSPWRMRKMATSPSWILISTEDLTVLWVVQYSEGLPLLASIWILHHTSIWPTKHSVLSTSTVICDQDSLNAELDILNEPINSNWQMSFSHSTSESWTRLERRVLLKGSSCTSLKLPSTILTEC
jgi:hypothetical protein